MIGSRSRKSSAAGSSLTATSTHRNRTKSLLRTLLAGLRLLIFALSLYKLGVYIYLVVTLKQNDVSLNANRLTRETLAILIISGTSVLWALITTILTCGGHSLSSIIMIVGDLLLMGAFIGVSILVNREDLRDCNRYAPLGAPRRDCRLTQASFAFAIALAVLYALAAIISAILFAHFRKARPFGPSPENGYHPEYNAVPRGKDRLSAADTRGYIPPMTTAGARTSALTDHSAYSGSTVAHPLHPSEGPIATGFTDPAAHNPVGGYEAYRAPVTRPEVAAAPAPNYKTNPNAF
ncbi:hypothetical protein DFH27DRAFT_524952 [Peziza echinospora]|nr:hypothetical protein DFH27DRAFT_524952 [Peziza echinospora]